MILKVWKVYQDIIVFKHEEITPNVLMVQEFYLLKNHTLLQLIRFMMKLIIVIT